MATQTVASDHSTACEEVEKEVKTEGEKMEPEKVLPQKESVENTKPEELACPTPPSVESEARIEEKKIETPVIEKVKEITVDEKPIAEVTAEVSVPPFAESTEQKIEDKLAESPPTEVKKTEDVPITEAKDILEKVPETAGILKPIIDTVECKSEDKTETETAVKQDESRLEAFEENLEDLIKKVDVPESSSVKVVEEKLEKVEEVPSKEVEAIEPKDVKVSQTECKAEDISESIPLVEEKPLEQSEAKEQTAKEPSVVEPVKGCEVETPVDKIEDSKLPTEVEVAEEETIAIESSDKVKSDTREIKVQEKDVECCVCDEVSEKTGETTEEKEPAKKTADVEGPMEEKTVDPGKIEAKTEDKSVVGDETPEKCEEKPIEDVTSSVPPPKVSEKATDEEVTSKDIELVAEKGNKDETVASAETTKDAEVDQKVEMEAEKTKTEEKVEERAQATETKLEEEKQVDKAPKTDVQNEESTKDCEETKTSQDAPKADVPVKTQKQSNNIIKMMKHSLVKAKKAIIGKSQNSKSPAASETKDDVTK